MATSPYLKQCWPSLLTHICGSMERWVEKKDISSLAVYVEFFEGHRQISSVICIPKYCCYSTHQKYVVRIILTTALYGKDLAVNQRAIFSPGPTQKCWDHNRIVILFNVVMALPMLFAFCKSYSLFGIITTYKANENGDNWFFIWLFGRNTGLSPMLHQHINIGGISVHPTNL